MRRLFKRQGAVVGLVIIITFILLAAVAWRDCWYMMIACAIGGYTGARNVPVARCRKKSVPPLACSSKLM